ncbi:MULTISPECIES: DUF3040 domain-containing protein [Crossiella]|uniref:Protein-S-isoprenylcysteine O-methyltransferase Ste14 n=1 Tax=Crossiella cryophila TaxID=43355 RepID=A0A7W7CI92_9PSEU|nr:MULTISPECIES: DUF3040 domain-containing protein [Crossiella]MBB4681777.1 protein-S-isoprenylcysteine O-methyltransferase Ste14 [Crossiella cryophila]MCK2243210.1 DUF3040 domain-containing protein [Crossiella sp. S99.2]MCK2254321.1 DUF3040 domain-containing protein [Crossiella sp. S99.1]MCO1576678.1 DUF3040 domain-containing protein [Crossiella sp. SN42]WHT17870.1 DUF3040 domain-containing protein [Crossiella sp. CA-258035]
MPLSEHEQRLLDQIERALYAEDPKFASTVRGARLRRPSRRRRLQGLAVFVVGLLLLVVGVILPVLRPAEIPVLSVVGFLLMFVGAVWGLSATNKTDPAAEEGGSPQQRSATPRRSSFSQRMEERFRRRFDDGDQH